MAQLEGVTEIIFHEAARFSEHLLELFAGFFLLLGEGFLDEFLVFPGVVVFGRSAMAKMSGADGRIALQEREEHLALAFTDEERTMRLFALNDFHCSIFLESSWLVLALHGGVQAIALELMHEMLGFFKAVADEDALAGVMDLEHVELGFVAGPAKNFLEDVGDEIHGVDGIIPANNEVTRFVKFGGFLLWPF